MDNWKFITQYSSACMVLDVQDFWNQKNVILRAPESDINPLYLDESSLKESNRIKYISTAAKITELENTA